MRKKIKIKVQLQKQMNEDLEASEQAKAIKKGKM